MNGRGKSDRPVVPGKQPNKGGGAPSSAEDVEGRGLAKGNTEQQTRRRTQSRERLQQALNRVRQVAERERSVRFTTLWHHVYDIDRLRASYYAVKRDSAAGVDGVTWREYGEDLEGNLEDLSERLKRGANGEVIFVRYADDFVVGFERREEAERFLAELGERLGRFGLELHPTKTRLIEFGRFAAERRGERGLGKPETFTFLGFTHICSKTRKGRFKVLRQTIGKRLRAKLKELKRELRRRMHRPTSKVGEWLKAVLTGHYRYYGVPGNLPALSKFRYEVAWLWYRTLRRRSQKTSVTWAVMGRLEQQWLPLPRVMHPYPSQRLRV